MLWVKGNQYHTGLDPWHRWQAKLWVWRDEEVILRKGEKTSAFVSFLTWSGKHLMQKQNKLKSFPPQERSIWQGVKCQFIYKLSFAFLEGCLSIPLLLVCRTEALLVIPSRWELDSQNGPLHLFFAFVLLLSCSPLLLPPCRCCLPAGVTEPLCRLLVPQSLAWIAGTEESLSAWWC